MREQTDSPAHAGWFVITVTSSSFIYLLGGGGSGVYSQCSQSVRKKKRIRLENRWFGESTRIGQHRLIILIISRRTYLH